MVARIAFIISLLLLAGCAGGVTDLGPEAPGGATSVSVKGLGAFSQPAANLDAAGVDLFRVGDEFFTKLWFAAPSDHDDIDGLGPTYLAPSCALCHVSDGRGARPGSLNAPDPVVRFVGGDLASYGTQLQTRGVPGVVAEATVTIDWVEEVFTYPDGDTVTMHRPSVAVLEEQFGDIVGGVAGARVAAPLHGLGLLEAIPDTSIVAGADPDDLDGDGISGRVARVIDLDGEERIGRFGYKANVASVADQTSIAYLLDMGITSVPLPDDNCPIVQTVCAESPSGGDPEISQDRLDTVVFYAQTLAVPRRTNISDDSVLDGERSFSAIGCDRCHVPRWETGDHEIAALADQAIYPYTDFLLHDLGEGLSDGRQDGDATPTEWRTAPLWGIGHTRSVNADAGFLHDGRATSIEEAILWHGGEAQASRDGFVALSETDRERLLLFLKSL